MALRQQAEHLPEARLGAVGGGDEQFLGLNAQQGSGARGEELPETAPNLGAQSRMGGDDQLQDRDNLL